METARNARENDEDFQSAVVNLLVNMNAALYEIRDLLKAPKKELDDDDICDMAVHYLIQCGPNLSEITRKLAGQGIRVRRQSLAEAKKFSRFREKLEVFRVHSGYRTDDGDIEAVE